MKIVCAWCDKDMGEKDGKGVEGVTHSICKQCSAKLKVEAKNRVASVKFHRSYLNKNPPGIES